MGNENGNSTNTKIQKHKYAFTFKQIFKTFLFDVEQLLICKMLLTKDGLLLKSETLRKYTAKVLFSLSNVTTTLE